jgi:hypothetical protein
MSWRSPASVLVALEERAARTLSESIKTRVATYFLSAA